MRLPLAALLTACALSAALLVAGRDGAEANSTMPGSEVVLPAAEGRALFADPEDEAIPDGGIDADLDRGLAPDAFEPNALGPETVPELPDPLDGGGLIPDGPDESENFAQSETSDASGAFEVADAAGIVFGSPADALSG
ncbi:hypothetical protein ACWCPF_20010 [Streptomyces sp. NPDC001858]